MKGSGAILATIGWILSWIAVAGIPLVEITTCTQGTTDSWLVGLVMYVPIAAIALACLCLGRTSCRTTRSFALPQIALIPLGAYVAIRYLIRSTAFGEHLCAIATGETGFASEARQWWNPLWAPLQLAVLFSVGAMVVSYWRGSPASPARTLLEPPPKDGAARGPR